ncbi:MAG: alpha/beta fold hydrolase [Candidatus Obscuribacterales bacterium]|nr:alpha/beta fold hydrolase [Candidatus Obscuribacterales bacterium]
MTLISRINTVLIAASLTSQLAGLSVFAAADTTVETTEVSVKTEKAEKSEKTKDTKFKESKSDKSTDTGNNAPCLSWVDPLQPTACCLLCIHGLGLNSGSYDSFGQRMASHGIATYAIDVRGFGSWMKAQGHSEVDFDSCLSDVQVALKSIRAAHPGKSIFLLGESMGGAIALRATSMYPDLIDGLISSVPAGERFKQKKTDLKVALEFLTGPNKQHNIGKSVIEQATKNEKLRDDWEDDPLDRMDLSAKELIQFQKFMNDNHEVAKQITNTPVLVVQGSRDKLVKPEGTWDIYNEIVSGQKDFLAVPSEHLIFEVQQDHGTAFDEKVASMIDAWIFSQWQANDKALIARRAAMLANRRQAKLDSLNTQRPLVDWIVSTGANATTAANRTAIPLPLLHSVTANSKQPVVLAFYAPWAEECKSVDDFMALSKKATTAQPRLIKINVEDHDNDAIVKACSVGPIPTFVFVTPDGHIAATMIGKNNFIDLAKGLKASPH